METEYILRLEQAPGSSGLEEDEIRMWPEQFDVLVKRILNQQEAQYMLPTMLSLSCSSEAYRNEYENLGMDFGLDSDGDDRKLTVLNQAKSNESDEATAILDTNEFDVDVQYNGDESTIVSTNKSDDDLDLRYVVYVPFLRHPKTTDKLEDVGKRFGSAIKACLLSMATTQTKMKTFHFDFHIPPEPTDSAVLASYRALQHADGHIGALIESVDSMSQNQERASFDAIRRFRRQPIDINPHLIRNDPSFCGFEPYKTFIVILDRPDFAMDSKSDTMEAAAVRFLLADGGKNIEVEGLDYLEMQIWRSAGMREVTRRLTMIV